MTIETKITYQYLMNKSKHELANWILDCLDEIDNLKNRIDKLEDSVLPKGLDE